jgi:hypothetical protein
MLINKTDEEVSILAEIRSVEKQLETVNEKLYGFLSKKKLLTHRLADLKYELAHVKG